MNAKNLLGLAVISSLLIPSSWAVFIDRGEVVHTPSRSSSSSRSGALKMNPAKTESQTVANTRTLSCTKENKGDYLSLGFLQSLVSSNEDISLRKTDRGTAILRMSKHVQNCMKLDFGFEKVGHDMLVMAKNVYDFKKEEVGVETVAELEDMTTEDKYVACLKNEGVLKTRDDGSYAFDRSAAKLADSQTTFNLDIQDKSKSMQLYFSSPKARDYATVYGDEGVPETTSKFPCLETERFAEPDPYLYVSDEDRLHYSANQACQTEDYETILSELSQLKSSSAGNAQELISVLKVALEDAREKRLSKIYDELEEIEDEFAPSRDDIAEGKLTGVTESRARSLGREYGELLSEVNELLYNPGIREVNDLMNELDEGVTPTREEEITQRISELNDEIGRFGKKDASNLGKVFDGLKEYGYTDEALKIEGFRLKSSNFSKVGPRGGNEKKISIEKADENIKKRLAEFERGTLRNWDDIHLAKSGSAEPIESLYQETQARTQRIQQMKQQFVQKEIAEDQKHCADNYVGGMRNPMECKRHREGRARRVQSFEGMMQQQSQQVQQQNARMAQLTQYYEEARRRNVAAEPQGGFYYDDPFGFYGSDSSSLYSLGGPQWNQQVMGLGMQGQYQMMGPVQGQYQNQGMMGQPPGTFNQGLQRPMWGY